MAAPDMASPGPPDPLSDHAKPPPNVVLPPKELRNVIERTAGYVARNGTSFEERIRQKEASNPKFSFLTSNDAYSPYYQWRMEEIKAGRGTDISAGRAAGDSATAVAQQVRTESKGPAKPAEFRFSARMPTLNAQDYEVIKLTALFCARNGRSWQTQLAQKEAVNYQFDFLRPQHSLYQFFMRLQDQYKELMNPNGREGDYPEAKRLSLLDQNIKNKLHILERAKARAEWVKYQARQKQEQEEEAEKERVEYAQIDWHDFVIVEEVRFDEADEEADLPPPTSLSDLQTASLEQKGMMSMAPASKRIEEAMPTEDMASYAQATAPQQNGHASAPSQDYARYQQASPNPAGTAYAPPVGSPMGAPPGMASPTAPAMTQDGAAIARDVGSDAQARARAAAGAGVPMNIRKDYQGRAGRQQRQDTALCPNCGQLIPTDKMTEHLRVEMLDPRWREQRQKEADRHSTTNLSTADVAQNLKRLASQRSDVFDGTTGEMLSEEEKERRKRAAMSYDGVIPGMAAHGPIGRGAGAATGSDRSGGGGMMGGGHPVNVQEQLRHIQQKAQQQ